MEARSPVIGTVIDAAIKLRGARAETPGLAVGHHLTAWPSSVRQDPMIATKDDPDRSAAQQTITFTPFCDFAAGSA
ncbi:hypothetical protein CDO28_34620 (plasmid) [Sinorhizobium meliloti]|nr:hypothetical protein CDO28_34620 [Sinorhizobium meliloti]